MGELNIYGVYVPVLLLQALLAYGLLRLLMLWLDRVIVKTWIIAPNFFYLCIYVILLGMLHWIGLAL